MLLHAYANPEACIEQRIEELARLFDDLPDPDDSDDAKTIGSYIVAAYGKKSSIYQALHHAISPRSTQMLEMINNDWFQDGRTQGFADGRNQGFADGFVEARARSLLDVLELRALPVSVETRQRILSSGDPNALERWLRRAMTSARVEEIFDPPASIA